MLGVLIKKEEKNLVRETASIPQTRLVSHLKDVEIPIEGKEKKLNISNYSLNS